MLCRPLPHRITSPTCSLEKFLRQKQTAGQEWHSHFYLIEILGQPKLIASLKGKERKDKITAYKYIYAPNNEKPNALVH